MYRRYYRYEDTGASGPRFPGTFQAPPLRAKPKEPPKPTVPSISYSEGEIITPQKPKNNTSDTHHDKHNQDKPEKKEKEKEKSGGLLGNLGLGNLFGANSLGGGLLSGNLLGGNLFGGLFGDGLFKDGKIFGRFQFDDILLGFLILVLLQNEDPDNDDLLLLLALGYIFLGDGTIKLFSK